MLLDEQIDLLSKEELEELYISLGEYADTPVSIDEFIEDPNFLGSYWADNSMYQFWRGHLRKIYPSPVYSPYFLVSLRGAIGLGKTSIACTGIAYDLHRLLSLANPQKTFGLVPTTKIVFSIFNVTMSLASDVVWDQLQQMFAASPYFTKLLGPLGTKKKGRDTLFPKRIDFTMGSRIGHSLGKAVHSAILDEANFGILDGQVYDNFNSLLRRIESRFTGAQESGMLGRIWLVSSETDKASVVNKVVDNYRGKNGVYVVQDSLWNVKPHRYGSERFLVYKGSEVRQPEIITPDSRLILDEPENIIQVPTEHIDSFSTDIHLALRDLAGVSTTSSYKLVRMKDRLNKVIMVEPLFPDDITIDFDDDSDTIEDKSLLKDYFRSPMRPDRPRNIHVDIALSGDRLGIAASYVSGFKIIKKRDEKTLDEVEHQVPTTVTDWAVGIKPSPGKQIPLFKIRMFIDWLASVNYPLGRITFDGFQSADSIQLLTKMGYVVEKQSVDITIDPYITLRNKIYDGTSLIPRNTILKTELEELEISSDYKKVDHPDKGSKDIADAVCGSVFISVKYAEETRFMDSIERMKVDIVPDSVKNIFGMNR